MGSSECQFPLPGVLRSFTRRFAFIMILLQTDEIVRVFCFQLRTRLFCFI